MTGSGHWWDLPLPPSPSPPHLLFLLLSLPSLSSLSLPSPPSSSLLLEGHGGWEGGWHPLCWATAFILCSRRRERKWVSTSRDRTMLGTGLLPAASRVAAGGVRAWPRGRPQKEWGLGRTGHWWLGPTVLYPEHRPAGLSRRCCLSGCPARGFLLRSMGVQPP